MLLLFKLSVARREFIFKQPDGLNRRMVSPSFLLIYEEKYNYEIV
jgi:hypothetical protein